MGESIISTNYYGYLTAPRTQHHSPPPFRFHNRPPSELPDYPAAVPVPDIPRADQDTHPFVIGVPDSEELPSQRYPRRTRHPPDHYQVTDMCTPN